MSGAISGATRVAGIIGDPVSHSRSPAIWNAAFRASGVDWVFVALPVAPGAVPGAFAGVRALGLAAITVTMPHKSDAASCCDELSAAADALGAVNAVQNRDGVLFGDATDGDGLVDALRAEGVDPAGQRTLVLGAGGAARAIVLAFGALGAQVTIASRRPDAAAAAARLAPHAQAIDLAAAETVLGDVDLVVNATPLGMQGEDPPFDVGRLLEATVVVDTVYHPAETPLLAAARARGIRAIGGLGMLVHQAARSFRLFTGIDAPIPEMLSAAHTEP